MLGGFAAFGAWRTIDGEAGVENRRLPAARDTDERPSTPRKVTLVSGSPES
jgi:hypothetical protein